MSRFHGFFSKVITQHGRKKAQFHFLTVVFFPAIPHRSPRLTTLASDWPWNFGLNFSVWTMPSRLLPIICTWFRARKTSKCCRSMPLWATDWIPSLTLWKKSTFFWLWDSKLTAVRESCFAIRGTTLAESLPWCSIKLIRIQVCRNKLRYYGVFLG